MAKQPRKPKSQFEISTGKPRPQTRAKQLRRDNDNVRDYKIKLKDVDEAINYYLNNIVIPTVSDNNESAHVPIIYGAPERWKSVQQDGFYKDQDGLILVPLIMFRRTNLSKNRELSSKIDANFPQLYQSFSKQWSKKNAYTPFSILNNISPILEQYNVIIPDYVNITYEFVIWTNFVDQMNDIVEAINYSEGSYWGEPEKFKFRTKIDDYSSITELDNTSDRMVRTSFTLTLFGYIISDSLNRTISNETRKINTNFSIKFGQETSINDNDIGYTNKQMMSRGKFISGSNNT